MEHVITDATPVPTRVRESVPLLVMMSSVSWACGDHVREHGADLCRKRAAELCWEPLGRLERRSLGVPQLPPACPLGLRAWGSGHPRGPSRQGAAWREVGLGLTRMLSRGEKDSVRT